MWSWFDEDIIDTGPLPLLLCFVAFKVPFVVTRVITRLIRSGGPGRGQCDRRRIAYSPCRPRRDHSDRRGLRRGRRIGRDGPGRRGRSEIVALAISCLGLVIIGLNPFAVDASDGSVDFLSALVSLAINFGSVAVTAARFDARYGPIARKAAEFIAGAPDVSPTDEEAPSAESSPV